MEEETDIAGSSASLPSSSSPSVTPPPRHPASHPLQYNNFKADQLSDWGGRPLLEIYDTLHQELAAHSSLVIPSPCGLGMETPLQCFRRTSPPVSLKVLIDWQDRTAPAEDESAKCIAAADCVPRRWRRCRVWGMIPYVSQILRHLTIHQHQPGVVFSCFLLRFQK